MSIPVLPIFITSGVIMLYSFIVASLLMFVTSTESAAGNLFPLPNERMAAAAASLRKKEFQSAEQLLAKAPPSGIRDFALAISEEKLNKHARAAEHFSKAADQFPLLADYSLYRQASALHRLASYPESAHPLQRLLKSFPESILIRPALLLLGDTSYELKDFKNAYTTYQSFIAKYAVGPDALSATYKSALCLEELGDTAGAVTLLRTIRLKNPASAFATKADKDLQRLAAKGIPIVPHTADEQLKYAATLYDLQRYDEALKTLRSLPLEGQPAELAEKYLLKANQALVKAKRYKEAEKEFATLIQSSARPEIIEEATYLQAKVFSKLGREDDAVNTLVKLAETASNADLADKALFDAALIRKGQNNGKESISLLTKLLSVHPSSLMKVNATWEIAWGSFLAGDMKTAADYLKILTENEKNREKALYWYGRSLSAAGDAAGAKSAFSSLTDEYPFGFYAQSVQTEKGISGELALPTSALCNILPVPNGFERIKALITLGLWEEARQELTVAKKKGATGKTGLAGIARLYLEMDDYNGAYNLLQNERPKTLEAGNIHMWGLCFPIGYRDHVTRLATRYGVSESLVYAIIKAESSFLPTARSPVGALGLMQLMPATAASMSKGGKGSFDSATLTHPETNIDYGVKHLRDLLIQYKGDTILAVAAYNAGSGNVNRWRKSFGELSRNEFIENIPFTETREYVKKVLSASQVYSHLYRLNGPVGKPAAPEISNAVPSTETGEVADNSAVPKAL